MTAKDPKESCGLHGVRVDTISIPLCTQYHSVYSVAKAHAISQIKELHDLLAYTYMIIAFGGVRAAAGQNAEQEKT